MKALLNYTTLAIFSVCIFSCSKQGCTDPVALNYSESATVDNGICQYPTNILISKVTIDFPLLRSDNSSWDEDGAPDTYIFLDDLTSEEIIYEVHRFKYSDTINNNDSGRQVFNLDDPMEIEVVQRMPHFRVSLFDFDNNFEGMSETICEFDFNDLSWYTMGEAKFPTTILMTTDECQISMEVKWGL